MLALFAVTVGCFGALGLQQGTQQLLLTGIPDITPGCISHQSRHSL